MNTLPPRLLHVPRTQLPNYLILSHYLTSTLSPNPTPLSSPHNASSTPIDHALLISTQLSACTNLHHLAQLHAHILRTHFLYLHPLPFHYNNLLRSYTKLNPNSHSPSKTFHIYIAMARAEVFPDTYTLPVVLKALSQYLDVIMVSQIHCVAKKLGLVCNMYCESGFISLYCKVGEFVNARKVFDENLDRKLGSWNAIIGGLSQGGRGREGIEMFLEMKRSGWEEDGVTMVSVLSACGGLGDLKLASQLHKCVFQAKREERWDVLVLNSVVDMYGKCGRMDLACNVFLRMEERNVSTWTSMIMGYAMHGHVRDALECFCGMREAGVRPNDVTFVGVLSSCVHGGTVEEGKYYFNMMRNEYGIVPKLQHYGCMVDLLGRAGLLEEAKEMIDRMPMKANVVIWGCLMGACEKYENVKMGEWVAKHLQELEPWNDGVYVVLSNIYASNGFWEEVERIRGIMKERSLAKVPGYSLETSPD